MVFYNTSLKKNELKLDIGYSLKNFSKLFHSVHWGINTPLKNIVGGCTLCISSAIYSFSLLHLLKVLLNFVETIVSI